MAINMFNTGSVGVGTNANYNLPKLYSPSIPSGSVQGTSSQKPGVYTDNPFPIGPTLRTSGSGGGGTPQVYSQPQQQSQPGQQGQVDSGPSMDSIINDIYNSGVGVYNNIEDQLKSTLPTQRGNINSSVDNDINKANTERDQLVGDVNDQETSFNKVVQSALQDAIRSYNAMQQQARSRFGFGSSAGQAVGELAQQEFFKQQGEQADRQTTGALAFEKERGRVKSYVKQKVDDLEQYRKEAIFSLEEGYRNRMNQIAMAKGELEANKNKARLEALQSTLSQMRQIEATNKQYLADIAASSIGKMQEVAGRAFTPKEIQNLLSEFGVSLSNPNYSSGITGGYSSAGTQQLKKTNGEDELSQLYQ